MRRYSRIIILLALAAGTLSLSACAAAKRPQVARHLSMVTAPGPADNNDLLIAFGLDTPEEERVLMATVAKADLEEY